MSDWGSVTFSAFGCETLTKSDTPLAIFFTLKWGSFDLTPLFVLENNWN